MPPSLGTKRFIRFSNDDPLPVLQALIVLLGLLSDVETERTLSVLLKGTSLTTVLGGLGAPESSYCTEVTVLDIIYEIIIINSLSYSKIG